ncbi:MAG: biotin--[acetyl-CoA-carboxylase] ligase [Saprospiraceae bacterium]|nr:biotin--[acetyl-CoA-carboxylase] ligase [Saprospiraceae bacterium]
MHTKNTLFIGKVLLDFPELESTNLYALELLTKSKPIEGTVISTFQQTQGRGQIGSSWESEPHKNLSLSVILHPVFLPLHESFALNLAISLAVRDFIAKNVEKTTKVKWPNDIYVGNRKICGILIQNSIGNGLLQSSVVGIGVNVNQTSFSTNAPNATSLTLETARTFPLYDLIDDLCLFVEQRYLNLKKTTSFESLRQEYLQHLYRYGEESSFRRADGSVFQGSINDIMPSGKLLINSAFGEETFSIKEISFL